jgi:hypothetical protein
MSDTMNETPEAAFEAFMTTMGDLFKELQAEPTYRGMQVEVGRMSEGPFADKIGCIRLVPVDDIGGNAARRVE